MPFIGMVIPKVTKVSLAEFESEVKRVKKQALNVVHNKNDN